MRLGVALARGRTRAIEIDSARMARRFERASAARGRSSTASPSPKRRERILRLGRRAQIDGGAGAVAQLEMPGDEVGVEVRQEDVRDPQAVLGGKGEILVDVALRIDDGRRVRSLVADRGTTRAPGNPGRTA